MAALILAVFNYPELYNVTLPNYRCTESRTNAWRSISIELGLTSERWKNMRDRYLKEVRMEIKSKKQGENLQSKWKYRQLMNFIAPFTGSRSGVQDICSNNDDNHDNPDNESVTQDTQMTPLAVLAKIPSPLHVPTASSAIPRDEDELFLLSFVPALKRLAPQKRCETKIKIQQIMYEAEFNVTQPESQEKKVETETAQ
uniref:BESS domain-containing protein n=1 Tax=Amphilophus citrinellus TaxID=61819 RepID=A0A3Q0SL89_AMPCI